LPKAAIDGVVLCDSIVSWQTAFQASDFDPREIEALDVREVVLIAQDLASYGHDRTGGPRQRESSGSGIVDLIVLWRSG